MNIDSLFLTNGYNLIGDLSPNNLFFIFFCILKDNLFYSLFIVCNYIDCWLDYVLSFACIRENLFSFTKHWVYLIYVSLFAYHILCIFDYVLESNLFTPKILIWYIYLHPATFIIWMSSSYRPSLMVQDHNWIFIDE